MVPVLESEVLEQCAGHCTCSSDAGNMMAVHVTLFPPPLPSGGQVEAGRPAAKKRTSPGPQQQGTYLADGNPKGLTILRSDSHLGGLELPGSMPATLLSLEARGTQDTVVPGAHDSLSLNNQKRSQFGAQDVEHWVWQGQRLLGHGRLFQPPLPPS